MPEMGTKCWSFNKQGFGAAMKERPHLFPYILSPFVVTTSICVCKYKTHKHCLATRGVQVLKSSNIPTLLGEQMDTGYWVSVLI